MTRRQYLPVLLGVVLLAGCSGGSSVKTVEFSDFDVTKIEGEATRTIEHVPPLAQGMTMVIDIEYGDVVVTTREGGKPSITAKMKIQAETDSAAQTALEGFEIVSGRTPEGMETRLVGEPITLIRADGVSTTINPTVNLEAVIPPGTPIILRTDTGHLEATGTFGAATLRSKMGDITISGVRGDLKVDSRSGDLRVEDVESPTCSLITKMGKIHAEGTFRILELRTDRGDVNLVVNPGSQVLMPWSVETAFGDMTIALPADMPKHVWASSAFGTVDSELPSSRGDDETPNHLTIFQGDGKKITISTQSGEIRIKRR